MVTFVPEHTTTANARWYADGEAVWEDLLVRFDGDRRAARTAMAPWEAAHPAPPVTLADVADQIEHVAAVAGIDHVGIGADFDGMDFPVAGLEDVSTFPLLFEELARRGWADDALAKLAGRNVLRVLEGAERTGARLREEGRR